MSATTQRWMKEELRQLLQQRERYQLAEANARDAAQARRRTARLRALDEEILGRHEALAALEVPVRKTTFSMPSRRRHPTLVSPTIGSGLAVMQPPRRITTSLAKVVAGSFALGFAATALLLVLARPEPRSQQATRREQPVAAPAKKRAPSSRPARLDTAVHAATAEPAARRR